ncbi:TNF receptor-associated factor 4-like isoform X2 [Watersipora subatra]|uniref:TNF receptor-associated factor 4-like isoform X2 n=1 Tax=Watersipora subatra TaxID=2589382 RepID=UPI00355BBB54
MIQLMGVMRAADVEIIFIDPLEKKYECPVCVRVLRYPVQFEDCGHRCCSSCLPELLRIAPRCPIDQSKVDREKVTVDKTFTKEIEGLAVKCTNHSVGCKWKGKLKDFYVHFDDCKYLSVPCPRSCGAEFEKRFVDKHLRDDCPKRDMTCEFCKKTIAVDEEFSHLNVCKRFPIPCPNGCKKKEIPREELDAHMESACTKQGIPCPFSEAGCEFRCARKEMNKHIRDEPVKHLTLVGQTILAHKKTLEMHSEIMDVQNEKLDKVDRKVESLEKLYGSQLIWKIDNYSAKLEEAKAGKKPTIFSPPFLTGRHGYKLAMSCCLFGDGKARGKSFSVFVCICKGEHDALLLWPFCHRVTFTLLDQCQDPEARRNVTYSVKPNTCKENKAFLGRPSGERNASFGAQKFCDLGIIDTLDYTRDDTLYLKVNIEMDDMVLL